MITNCANVQLKGGSLFDGIGGFPLAGTKFGIDFVWASEIEAFPISVTEKHFPNMKHLGDITKINGAEIEPVDVINLGSPCQDLSVAGKRAGFKGPRSGLFMEAVRIIREMREKTNGQYPRFAVWENVPGAFSSKCGADFRAVLEEIAESEIPMPSSGKWATAGMVRSNGREIAWRVLDAQYWGVPQRRKRIFLVADFRGHCASEILFVEESLRGDITKSCGEGQRITRSAETGTDKRREVDVYDMAHADEGIRTIKNGVVQTLNARMGTGGNQVPLVGYTEPIMCFEPGAIPINDKATRYKGGGDTRNNDGAGNGLGIGNPGDPSPTLTAGDRHAAAFGEADLHNYKQDRISTLKASGGCLGGGSETFIAQAYRVRRLTPTECERLQGLPDGYTITDKASDTARYKALGNGMAQPCVDYVISGIAGALKTK